jgi:hypothetical protein
VEGRAEEVWGGQCTTICLELLKAADQVLAKSSGDQCTA